MNNANQQNGLISAFQHIAAKKWTFLVMFIMVFVITISICSVTGFIPNPITATSTAPSLVASAAEAAPVVTLTTSPVVVSATDSGAAAPNNGQANMSGDLPVAVKIPTIGVDVTVSNPTTFDVDVLDNYLLKGAARYPSSATLSQNGTVILFGHSSYLPIVNNKAFKTFDGIQNLKAGDQIEVDSATTKYVYSVQTVEKKDSTSDGIALSSTGHELVLATCDSFTKKTDRFVVTSTLVGSYPLGS
jgi:LPXTG-site transpeptidase (sortase) family protein